MKRLFLLFLSNIFLLSVVHSQVSVTATGGTLGPTTYTDFITAFTAINAGTHTGVITVSVTASFTQTTTASLNASGTGSASYTALTIKPATGATPAVTVSTDNTAAIKLDGADNVTIDGSNNGTTTRDLTIQNSNSGGSGSGVNIWIASNGTNGATNNVIKNCRLMGSSYSLGAAYMGTCILSSNTTMAGYWVATSISTAANSNNLIQNNLFSAANAAVVFKGGPTVGETGNQIIGNTIGDVSFPTASRFTNLGIYMVNQASFTIERNTIQWINSTNTNLTPGGIVIDGGCTNGTISRNGLTNIKFTTTPTSGGIVLNSGAAASINVYNNFISDVASNGSTTAITGNGHGIAITGGTGYNIGYNSVNMNTNPLTTANGYQTALFVNTGVTTLNVRNNLFIHSGTNTTNKFSIYSMAANPAGSTINYNCYYTTSAVLGYAGSALNNLVDVNTSFQSTLANSKNVLPVFVAANDLHLVTTNTTNTTNLAGSGTPITGVTVDYDAAPRSAATPTIGGHELVSTTVAPGCVTTPTLPANAGSVCLATGTTTLSWPAVAGATGYDVYLNTGATATTVVATNQAGTTYSATIAAGPYAWKVVPKNSVGAATSCATFTFTVDPNVTPTATISATPTGAICTGTSVTYTVATTNAGTTPTYQWKKRTTNVGTSTTTYTDNTLITGDTISVVLTSNAACASPAGVTSNLIIPTVLPRPTASTTPSGNFLICNGSSISLKSNTAIGFTYQWQLNGVNIAGATDSLFNVTAAGAYRVIVSNGACADTSGADTATVIARPVSIITTPTTAFCQGSSLTLAGPAPVAGITYQWQLNSADIAGATNDTYVANAAGNYRLVLSNGTCADTSAATTLTVNPLPTATATAAGPTSFCTGGSVVLNANTGTGITYRWFRNNILLTGAIANSYTATTTGSYAVVVTSTATGCMDTSRPAISVTLFATPGTTLTPSGNLTFCQGSNVTLNAPAGTGFTYVWYRNSVIIAGATAASYVATTAGTYNAVVTNGPCVSTTISRTVVVNPLPTATITAAGPIAFCNGGSVVLNANTGTGLTYQWRLNTINITGATSAGYTATASGTYSVVVSNGTCTNTSNNIIVNVSTMPAPVITAVGAPTFCQGNSVTLQATTGAGYTYQWQLNTVNIAGATAATLSATASGNYTVTITNGTCVAGSAPFAVSVTPAPPAVITPAGPTSFCQGGNVVLNANRGTGYTYQWTLNSAPIPGATGYTYTAYTTGNYGVNIFDGTCPATSPGVAVTVNNFPVAIITVVGADMSTGTFASYQWYRNGELIPGATAQNYTAVSDGFYSVVVTDALGCSATSSVQQITALDVTNVNVMAVKLYPNPVENILNVEAAKAVNISINAIDGKQLLKADNAKSIDLSHLAQGLYLVRITDAATGALIRVDKVNKR